MKISFLEVKELGFEHYQMNDSIFYEMNGYDDFIMELIVRHIRFVWYPDTKTVLMQHMKKSDILASIEINDINQVKLMVEFFKAKGNKQFKLDKTNFDYTMYA